MDNQISMEFDHSSFYIKDLHSKEVNTQGPSQHGLYKMQSGSSSSGVDGECPKLFLASLKKWNIKLGL